MISIIIPCYNEEGFIERAIHSVLQQDEYDWELICINDGSCDKTSETLHTYTQEDKRICVIDQPNRGVASARNTGLDYVKGDYIVFLDANNILPPYALSHMLHIAQRSLADVVVSECYDLNTSSQPQLTHRYQLHTNVLKDIVASRKAHSQVWNKMYRASILQSKRFIDGIYFEDWPFTITLFADIKSYASTKIPCYVYTLEQESIVRSGFTQEKIASFITGIRYVHQYFLHHPERVYAQRRISDSLQMCINKTYRSKENRTELAGYLKKEIKNLKEEGIISPFDLSLKSYYRLWKMA